MNARPDILRSITVASSCARPHFIICPFGGASQSSFRSWMELQAWDVGASLVVYPGREHRICEPASVDIASLARELAHELGSWALGHRLWCLIGHSLGAQVAFETCRLLERRGQAPDGLVLSACQAPHLRPRRTLGQLDDEAFIERLVEAGGCPPELREDAELEAFYLPMLRRDFLASETYHRALHPSVVPLETQALLLHGSDDEEASRDEVAAWQAWLARPAELQVVTGGHFYITKRPMAVVRQVLRVFPGAVSGAARSRNSCPGDFP